MTRWAILLPLFAACTYTDPGTGTGTLFANIEVSYKLSDRNATVVKHARVERGGSALGGAQIVLVDGDTGQSLPFSPNGSGTPSLTQYRRRLTVTVTADTDTFQCALEGPAPHTLATPLQGAVASVKEPLKITWQTPDGLKANEVDVLLANSAYARTIQGDIGTFTVPAAELVAGPETVTVRRRNKVEPQGAVPGSSIELSYEGSVAFLLQ